MGMLKLKKNIFKFKKNFKKPNEVHYDYYKCQEKSQDHENNLLNQKQVQQYSGLAHTKLQSHLKNL